LLRCEKHERRAEVTERDLSKALARGAHQRFVGSLLCTAYAAVTLGLSACSDTTGGEPCLGTGTLPSDSLETFSGKCLEAIGLDVPAFNCDDGTLVPENNLSAASYPNQTCDAPNVLSGVCDPGSRFQVLAQTAEAIVVAHCRKKGRGDGSYGDIAVIQYNQINGATCFYQALALDLPAAVTAPSEGIGPGTFPWLTPADTADINCVRCHDNGPLIRSPYLAQLRNEPTNRLPGTNDNDGVWGPRFGWNLTQPYTFVGNDFQDWKVQSLSVANVTCTGCHRMGISSSDGQDNTASGTALSFGPIATAAQQSKKNPHSADSPIWMKPDQIVYHADVETEALAVQNCAQAILGNGIVPAGCMAVQYGQGDTCSSVGLN